MAFHFFPFVFLFSVALGGWRMVIDETMMGDGFFVRFLSNILFVSVM
jgi:hypothetical protein